MLRLVVQPAGGDALASAFLSAAIAAATALLVAIVSGSVAVFVAVGRAEAEARTAAENAQTLLGAAERQAAATLQAAVEQAAGVRDAGLRNAIETEAMKLRFRIVERHMEEFRDRAAALLACLPEMPGNRTATQRFLDAMPHVPRVAMLEAQQAVRPQDFGAMSAPSSILYDACAKVEYALRRSNLDPAPKSAEYDAMTRGQHTAIAAIQHVVAVVNVSSVARAQGTGDAAIGGAITDLNSQWEQKVSYLKKTGL